MAIREIMELDSNRPANFCISEHFTAEEEVSLDYWRSLLEPLFNPDDVHSDGRDTPDRKLSLTDCSLEDLDSSRLPLFDEINMNYGEIAENYDYLPSAEYQEDEHLRHLNRRNNALLRVARESLQSILEDFDESMISEGVLLFKTQDLLFLYQLMPPYLVLREPESWEEDPTYFDQVIARAISHKATHLASRSSKSTEIAFKIMQQVVKTVDDIVVYSNALKSAGNQHGCFMVAFRHLIVQICTKDQGYKFLQSQPLGALHRRLNAMETESRDASSWELPEFIVELSCCRALLRDIRKLNRIKVITSLLARVVPFEIAAIVAESEVDVYQLRKRGFAGLYGRENICVSRTRCQEAGCVAYEPMYFHSQPRQLPHYSEKQLTCPREAVQSVSTFSLWSSHVGGVVHSHYVQRYPTPDLSFFDIFVCSFALDECPGHFEKMEDWLLCPPEALTAFPED